MCGTYLEGFIQPMPHFKQYMYKKVRKNAGIG